MDERPPEEMCAFRELAHVHRDRPRCSTVYRHEIVVMRPVAGYGMAIRWVEHRRIVRDLHVADGLGVEEHVLRDQCKQEVWSAYREWLDEQREIVNNG